MLPIQEQDFEGIFEAMDGKPVIMRLIDPPMHEFLPPREELIEEVATLRCTKPDSEELAEAAMGMGFIGVKLYNSLGYRPLGNGDEKVSLMRRRIAVRNNMMTYLFDGETVVPYLAFTLGGTHVRTRGADSEDDTFFSGSIGLGLRIWPESRVGLRVEARAYGTLVDSKSDIFCVSAPADEVAGCAVRLAGDLADGTGLRWHRVDEALEELKFFSVPEESVG